MSYDHLIPTEMKTAVSDVPKVSNTIFGYMSAIQFHSDDIYRESPMCQHCTQSEESKEYWLDSAICREDWPTSIPRTVSGVLFWKHVQSVWNPLQSNEVFQALSLCEVHLKTNTGLFKHNMPQDWQTKTTCKNSRVEWVHSKSPGYLPILALLSPELHEEFDKL